MRCFGALWLVGAATSVLASASGCSPPGLGPLDGGAGAGGAPNVAGADAGTGPDAPTVPTPLSLAGTCDRDLRVAGALRGTEGTLPVSGPYHPCRILSGHDYTKVRISDDGRRVAALTTAGQILILDSRTLTLITLLARARGPYTMMALSADGARVAAGSDADGEVDVWRAADHALLRVLDLAPTWPTLGGALALSKDGTRVATVAGTNIVIADVATGATRTLPASRIATALFFVDGDRKLAFAGGDFWSAGTGSARIELIDIETGEVQTLLQYADIYGVDQLEASADGTTLLTLGHAELALWNVATGEKRLLPQPAWEEGAFQVYGLSADGSELATSLTDAQTVRFQRRSAVDGSVVAELPIDPTAHPGFAWSSRAQLLATAAVGTDGAVTLATIDLASSKVKTGCAGRPAGQPIAFSEDGLRLVAQAGLSLDDGTTLFDVATGQAQGPLLPNGPSAPGAGAQWSWRLSPDWRWIAWTTDTVEGDRVTKQVHVIDTRRRGERTLLTWQSDGYGTTLAFSADSRNLAVVDTNAHPATVLDVASGATLSQVPLSGRYASALDFLPDGSSLLIGEEDAVRTVRWTDGATLAELPIGYDSVATAPDGTVVIFGASEARTYRGGAEVATMPGIDDFCFGFIPDAVISDDSSTVALGASCSRPFTLRQAPHVDIRETDTGALIQQVTGDAPVVFSPDASMFAGARGLLWCR